MEVSVIGLYHQLGTGELFTSWLSGLLLDNIYGQACSKTSPENKEYEVEVLSDAGIPFAGT